MTESRLVNYWKYGYQYNIEIRHGRIEKDISKKKATEMTPEELQKVREEMRKTYNYKG